MENSNSSIEKIVKRILDGAISLNNSNKLNNYLNEIIKQEHIDLESSIFDLQNKCAKVLLYLNEKGKLNKNIIIELFKNGYKINEYTPEFIKNDINYILIAIKFEDYQVIDYISDSLLEKIPKEIVNNLLDHYEINCYREISKSLSKYLKYVLKMLEQDSDYGLYMVLDYTTDEVVSKLPKEYIIKAIDDGYMITFSTPKKILENKEIIDYAISRALKEDNYTKVQNILENSLVFSIDDIEKLKMSKDIKNEYRRKIIGSCIYNKYFNDNLEFVKYFIEEGYLDILNYSSEQCVKKLENEKFNYIKYAFDNGYIFSSSTCDYLKSKNKYILQNILKLGHLKNKFAYEDCILENIQKEKIIEVINDRYLLNDLTLQQLTEVFSLVFNNSSKLNDMEVILDLVSEKINCDKTKLKTKLIYLFNKNNFLYDQINFEILDSEFDFIDIEVLNRIIPDRNIMELLIKYKNDSRWKKTKNILKICLDYIKNIYGQNTNYDEIIYKILTQGISTNNFDTLFENINVLNKQQTRLLIKLLLNKENVFNINYPDELNSENFDEIRKNYFKDEEEKIKESIDINYIRYQILYKIYNITKEDVDLIFKRYCHDLTDQQNINSIVKNINYIMRCDNINELKDIYFKIKNPIFNYDKFIMYESNIRNEYIKKYNTSLYVPTQDDLLEIVEYKNEKVPVYEIQSDFYMIIHVYNAIANDSLEDYERVRSNSSIASFSDWNANAMLNHGICCSFISQDFFALASMNLIKFGFINLENDSLIHMNSHDIFTGNESFGETYTKIEDCFFDPKNLIVETSKFGDITYNELVLERKKLDSKSSQYKRQPDYLLYLYDKSSEIPIDLIRVAINFKIPIVKVNMQKTIERQINKIDCMIIDLEETQNVNLLKDIVIKILCNLSNTVNNPSLYKYEDELNNKVDKIINLIDKEKYINKSFALSLYKEILILQKQYPLLNKKKLFKLYNIFINKSSEETKKTK